MCRVVPCLCPHTLKSSFTCVCRSAHEVLRGQDTSLLAPEDTPEEVLREREARAAAVSAVHDKLRAGAAD
jgi:hypothetical protein